MILLRYTLAVLRVLALSRLAALLFVLLFGFLNFAGCTGEHQARKLDGQVDANSRPNVLLVLTDDMRAGQVEGMPFLKNHLIDKGTSFRQSFVSTSMCCPSRATLLTGKYAHNHGVKFNEEGARVFRDNGAESDTISTRLQQAGYETMYSGKYLNQYGTQSIRANPTPPPGWDRWVAYWGKGGAFPAYEVNNNGAIVEIDARENHETDYFAAKVERFIRANRPQPWIAILSPKAPHAPATPPGRYADTPAQPMPRPPSFQERDVSDKPAWASAIPPLDDRTVRKMESLYRDQQRDLLAVDDALRSLNVALRETGQRDNTYVIFTSDNGLMFGEHRLDRKRVPYEEAIRVPLVINGPGVAAQRRGEIVGNIDWAPTVADWSGISTAGMDGRSLTPLLSGAPPPAGWRDALLIEAWGDEVLPDYSGVRTQDSLYVEYATGEKELYDLEADPHQLENLADQRPDEEATLHARIEELKSCAGKTCREAEGGT